MLFPTRVDLDQAAIERLVKLYATAYKDLAATLETATEFSVARNSALMAQITQRLQQLGDATGEWISTEIPPQYQKGIDDALAQMAANNMPTKVADNTLALINHESVNAIMSDMSNKFGMALSTIGRSVDGIISAGLREQIRQRIAQGELTGQARRTISAAIKQALTDDGIFALRDAGGKKWALDTYAQMLARTKMTESRNTGLTDLMMQNGYTLAEVSAHGAEDACGPWEGEIVDVSNTGESGYPTINDAITAGLFHPNCQHAINVIADVGLAQKTYGYNSSTGEYDQGNASFTDETDI